jgi:AcrR family transcriptional regulator
MAKSYTTEDRTERGEQDGSEARGTRGEIMDATYEALRKHGYADLTIQTIADEFPKSKSLLYYHYDTKEDLLVDFLDWLVEEFTAEVGAGPAAGPTERIEGVFEMLVPRSREAAGEEGIRLALLDLRMQAARENRFAERFSQLDERVEEELALAVREGIERGQFREVDPERTASVLLSLAGGASLLRVSTGDAGEASAQAVHRELQSYLEYIGA